MRSRSGNDGFQTYPDMATCVDETGLTGHTDGVLPVRHGHICGSRRLCRRDVNRICGRGCGPRALFEQRLDKHDDRFSGRARDMPLIGIDRDGVTERHERLTERRGMREPRVPATLRVSDDAGIRPDGRKYGKSAVTDL